MYTAVRNNTPGPEGLRVCWVSKFKVNSYSCYSFSIVVVVRVVVVVIVAIVAQTH